MDVEATLLSEATSTSTYPVSAPCFFCDRNDGLYNWLEKNRVSE